MTAIFQRIASNTGKIRYFDLAPADLIKKANKRTKTGTSAIKSLEGRVQSPVMNILFKKRVFKTQYKDKKKTGTYLFSVHLEAAKALEENHANDKKPTATKIRTGEITAIPRYKPNIPSEKKDV